VRPGASRLIFYLDIGLEESFARHRTRPQARDFSTDDMRASYRPTDVVAGLDELVIADAPSPETTAERVIKASGLLAARI
jgi:hypothetical protein